MRRRSLFFVAAILMMSGIPIYYYNYYLNSREFFEQETIFRKRVMAGYLEFARLMVESHQQDRLVRILDEAVKNHMFDWYIISHKGEPVLYNPPEMRDAKFSEVGGNLIQKEGISSGTIYINNDSYLTLGINTRWLKYMTDLASKNLWSTIQENGLPILMAILIFAFLLKDMLKITRALKAGKGLDSIQASANKKALTQEGQVFSEIMQGYQQSVDRLSSEKQVLEGQVLPSLRSELASGKVPPYEFDCVMVRTDINRYSQMFASSERAGRDVLMSVIDRFFSEATKIVSRYGGYMHEFVGDELIFYIKDEEVPNAVSMALGCLSEIQEATSSYQDEVRNAFGLPFTVKSSLACGRLRYGHLVNGFSLAGPPLIESVRILSLIEDRDRNQIYAPENFKERADETFVFESKGDFLLKGYSHNRVVYELISRQSLSSLLLEMNTSKIGLLGAYRHPHQIQKVFQFLLKETGLSSQDVLKVMLQYRDVFIGGAYPELRDVLISLAEHFRGRSGGETITPTVIRMTIGLVSKELYQDRMKDFFIKSLDVEVDRGVANTLEAYGYFENIDVYEIYRRFKAKGSSRVIGNILLLWGEKKIDAELSEIFLQRFKSNDQAMIASCLYAYAEILNFWQKRDLVYLKAQVEFFDLEKIIQKISKNQKLLASEPLQRQVKRALAGLLSLRSQA